MTRGGWACRPPQTNFGQLFGAPSDSRDETFSSWQDSEAVSGTSSPEGVEAPL